MKLYYSPGACSLADHIALLEGGLDFELESVELGSKRTASGVDFTTVNPKGYVPALVLDDGEVITENLAVLDWIAARIPSLGPGGPLGRTRLLEALGFLSSEVHKSFKPLFAGGTGAEQAAARLAVAGKLRFLADRLAGPYLFGDRPGVADFYLFVMLLWTVKFGIEIPEPLRIMRNRLLSRPAVQAAMRNEGLNPSSSDSDSQAAEQLRGKRAASA